MPKYPITDFSKGITDYIYKSGDSFSEILDNLIIDDNLGLVGRFGSRILSNDYPRVPTNDRITKIFEFKNDLILRSLDKLYALDLGAGFTEVQGQGNRSIFYTHSAEEYIDHAVLNNQMIFTSTEYKFRPLLAYKSTAYEATTLGLPVISSLATPTVTPAAGGDSVSYIYAFVFFREYTSNSLTFQEFSTPTYVPVVSAAATEVSAGNAYSIANIPELVNGLSTFWKTDTGVDDIKVRIYRTTNNGSVLYYLGDATGLIDNGTAVASDEVEDADLALNEILYTEGGIVENDAPPIAKYVTVAKESAWFANLLTAPNRIMQSKPLQPYAVPGDFYIDVEEDITGIATTRDFPIVFTKNKVYRIDGQLDELGRGVLVKEVITDQIGCINHRTIVPTKTGIYFAGINGWYWTDGYNHSYISEQIDKRFQSLISLDSQVTRMTGTYHPRSRKVFFSVQEGGDNDKLYIFDEQFSSWTTMSGYSGFVPTAIGVLDSSFLRADDEGYIYMHDDSILVDPHRDTTVAVTSWRADPILYDWKHVAVAMGDIRLKKWTTKVNIQIDNQTGQHVDVGAFDERSYTRRVLKPIIVVGALPWGSAGTAWGSAGITWGGNEMISKTRRFPAGKIRTRFKQLSLKNAWVTLFDSVDYDDATVNSLTKQITIDSGTWPSDIVGNSITIDDGSQEFGILTRNSDILITVYDPGNALVSGSFSWKIVGYKKSENLNLQAIAYTYVPISDRGSYYESGEDE